MAKKCFIIISFLMLGFLFNSCHYFVKALIYQTADIDDYKIFHNRKIKATSPTPWDLADNYNKRNLTKINLGVFDEYGTVAFIIIKDNKILHEKYWRDYDKNSIVNSFSATKSIVSLLIGIAIDEGKIKSVDQKVKDFLPDFNVALSDELSIKHLLLMSAGTDWKEQYASPFSVTTRAYYGRNIKRLAKRIKVKGEPEKLFEYKSGNTQLLSFILQKATGMQIADYASEKLWKPLGAENEALWCLDRKNGNEKAYCCFTATARDFARIGQLILNEGKWGNKQIISKEYLDAALLPAIYLKDPETGQNIDYYGYHWWILNYKGYKIPYARGIMGQYIFVVPHKNAVVVRLGHKRDKKYKNGHPIDTFKYLDIAMNILE